MHTLRHVSPATQSGFRPAAGHSPRRRASALGVTLRHFTDHVRRYRSLHAADLHSATTVLTKQVEARLGARSSIGDVAELLLDPQRAAFFDGTTAAELLRGEWSDFVADVDAQLASTLAFARLQGDASLLSLSAWYGASDGGQWWGTPEWTACLDLYAQTHHPRASLLELLHATPEVVDHLTLSRVLHGPRHARSSAHLATEWSTPA